MTDASKIIYTYTDESPALATHSFLPVISAYTGACNVGIDTRDISLAARTLAAFADVLPEEQRMPDTLAELGEAVNDPDVNIIKLPNISASTSQLKVCIGELQAAGYDLPDYPNDPDTDEERDNKARYDKVKGSAVNPVLRQGNSDRRAPESVKQYARKNPHWMGEWTKDSHTHVATMAAGDFRSNEQSVLVKGNGTITIDIVTETGETIVLRDNIPVSDREMIDGTFMSYEALKTFLAEQVAEAKDAGVLFSVHLKATMMKVSDPVIFGHVLRAYFADIFEGWADELDHAGVNPNEGLARALTTIEKGLDKKTADQILADIEAAIEDGPELAYVNADKSITNLHVPSDVIIDASMPAMIRNGGKMRNAKGELADVKAVIPDSSYAPLYDRTVEFCKIHGAFNPKTMGTVQNVGLMANKAEEYGSHDKTFVIEQPGTVRVIKDGVILMRHDVKTGDIWRACQTKDEAVRDWVKLAVDRARATEWPAIFWLDTERAHDAVLLNKVNAFLDEHDTTELDIQVMNVADATEFTLKRLADGEDTLSITGNVLRDYVTDMFPIFELGTSAKMLSIVPLMNGGGLFETGAGGSAPKLVEQMVAENHLRWDSLGEYLALSMSLAHEASVTGNTGAKVLGKALENATTRYLLEGKSPQETVGDLDNRGSTFYLALYWAQEMAGQREDSVLSRRFGQLAKDLVINEKTIVEELNAVQGQPVKFGGYYAIDRAYTSSVMRPSVTFNKLIDDFATQPNIG